MAELNGCPRKVLEKWATKPGMPKLQASATASPWRKVALFLKTPLRNIKPAVFCRLLSESRLQLRLNKTQEASFLA